MSRWVLDDVYPTGVLLENKHELEMDREMYSNIKYLRGAVRDWLGKSRHLVAATSGMQGARRVLHHLT